MMTSVVVKSILTVAVLMLMAAVVQATEVGWRTLCGDNEMLTNWKKVFSCRHIPVAAIFYQCKWSGWISDVNGIVRFSCPNDYILTAMKGFYDASVFTRLDFKCCWAGGTYLSNCGKNISNSDDAVRSVIHGLKAIDNDAFVSSPDYEFNMCDIVFGTPPTPADRLSPVLPNSNSNGQLGGVNEFK